MSLGPAGASLNPEQADNFEDVYPSRALSHFVLTPEQMEKQFAVKGPPIKALPNVYRRRP